ncbi:MAG: HAD family hydrolase [Bacteroidetes bacterium]|nr:HAD family hydrolase [Bacteroidota bacterium]
MNPTIVFDLDGTLITCESKQKYVLLSLLNAMDDNTAENLEAWWELKREGMNTEKALTELGYSDAKSIADQWKREIEKYVWGALDKPFEDSLPTLSYLKGSDKIGIIILTGRKCKYQVRQIVNSYGFNEYIDDLIVVDPYRAVEKKSEYLRKIKPFVYVGDTEIDYLSATSSGVRFVALTRGQRSRNFLRKVGNMQTEDDLKFLNNINHL